MVRRVVGGAVAGATLVSAAWAGVGLVPVDSARDTDPSADVTLTGPSAGIGGADATGAAAAAGTGLQVGASKVSMYPRPDDYGGYWEQDAEKCTTLAPATLDRLVADPATETAHYTTAGSPWPENPNCIYMGGFDIGPMNPAVEFDEELGLWVRSVAIGDGTDTLILTIIDAEGYFWDYATKCDCGAKQLGEELGAELGIAPESFVIAATHSHAAPDLIGGWGFVPDWYMRQVADAIRTSIRDAVADMADATVEVGEVEARPHNRERRDTYRSAEEQQLTWLRARAADGSTIATIGAFAGHPTTTGTNSGVAHPDWPGLFERRLEERFGGIGLHFMTGLGNMSAAGGTEMGTRLADLVPAAGGGLVLTDTDLRVSQSRWRQPTTNVPLDALGLPGFFDRTFLPEPSTVRTGKSPDTAPCLSTSAATVELPITAVRIGSDFALTAAPGEVFANLTNTIKDRSGAKVTMPLGQANDALGYMPQSFEMSPIGQQGLGFVAGGVLIVNYEDSYSVDRCVGDMVLETSLSALDALA